MVLLVHCSRHPQARSQRNSHLTWNHENRMPYGPTPRCRVPRQERKSVRETSIVHGCAVETTRACEQDALCLSVALTLSETLIDERPNRRIEKTSINQCIETKRKFINRNTVEVGAAPRLLHDHGRGWHAHARTSRYHHSFPCLRALKLLLQASRNKGSLSNWKSHSLNTSPQNWIPVQT